MSESKKAYDLVSLGEPLLRLSPPGRVQLRRATSLDVVAVGSQLNVSANLAQLGWRTSFLTRLPDNPLGLLVRDACRQYGIDTSHIKMVSGAKMGMTFVEFSVAPREPLAVYDRAGSAAGTAGPRDFDWPAILSRSRHAYLDGIFPSLSSRCTAAAKAYLAAARRARCTVAFDLNYRRHLCTPASARRQWPALLQNVDILVVSRDVSKAVFGFVGADEDIMRSYADRFGCRTVCMTYRHSSSSQRGAYESLALEGSKVFRGKRQEFEIVDRYGAGDAWMAGFLYGRDQRGAQFGLDFANGFAALAHTVFGDVAFINPSQVLALLGGEAGLHVKR